MGGGLGATSLGVCIIQIKRHMKNFISIILFFPFLTFGQEFNFDIHNLSLSKAMEIEGSLGSKKIKNEYTYMSGKGMAQPISFQRNENEIPDCIVRYSFYEKDSVLTEINYEWDVYNFEKQDNNQKSEEFEQALIKKYIEIKDDISSEFGKPKIESNYSNLAQYEQKLFFEESSTWEPNDSTIIELYTTVSNYYEKIGSTTINPVHRIRLFIKKTDKNEEISIPRLDDQKLSELGYIKTEIFKALESKDIYRFKEFLSDLIKEKVTDEQINMLIDNINFERTTELVYSGIQMSLDGKIFTLLQYKYVDDISNPPNEMIKLIFDDKDKVIDIQPTKLEN